MINLAVNNSIMKKFLHIILIAAVIAIAGNPSMAQRFRMEEADGNSSIEVLFDAYRIDDQVQLIWNVNAENNIRSYEIIRGHEHGRYMDWEVLNQVGVERTNAGKYLFVDGSPLLGEMHYRLKIVAPDGSHVEYSPLFKIPQQLESSIKQK
jgi:hypothetical protein